MTELDIVIDPESPVPPFEQVRDGITALIVAGDLPPGRRLPPVRTLASSLGLAANTVARSYKELEAAGFVETRGRGGTVVAPRLDDAARHQRMRELTRDYLDQAAALGVEPAAVVEYIRRAG